MILMIQENEATPVEVVRAVTTTQLDKLAEQAVIDRFLCIDRNVLLEIAIGIQS